MKRQIVDGNDFVLLHNVEKRNDEQIYVTFFNEDYFIKPLYSVDDHDVIYKIDNSDFYKEFKKLKNIKDDYNNSYVPINFKTEEECVNFLNSLGFKPV